MVIKICPAGVSAGAWFINGPIVCELAGSSSVELFASSFTSKDW